MWYCWSLLALYVKVMQHQLEEKLRTKGCAAVNCAFKIPLKPKYYSVCAFFCCQPVFPHIFLEKEISRKKSGDGILPTAEHRYGVLKSTFMKMSFFYLLLNTKIQ